MPQIGIRFEELAFNDKAYDAESSSYFTSFFDSLTPYDMAHILNLIDPQNLHRLTTKDKPATCKPDARISFANLFSLHIFLQNFKNTDDPMVLRNFIASIGTWGNYFNMGHWGKLWELMGNLGASDFIVWKPLNVF